MNPSRTGLRLLCRFHAPSPRASSIRVATQPFSHSSTRSADAAQTAGKRDAHSTLTATSSSTSNSSSSASPSELGVGEIEGASFRVEPLRRVGEDSVTMRARLQYQSRKRGILESDLLLSTFADANLGSMSKAQLEQYDLFLDENDWDIYYWATQSPADADADADSPTTSAEGGRSSNGSSSSSGGGGGGVGGAVQESSSSKTQAQTQSQSAEWAQTVGRFKPAYRPVPARWKDSEILSLLRKHVRERSAGGVLDDVKGVEAGSKGAGLGRMPEAQVFDS